MSAVDWRGVSILVGSTVVATHGRSTAPFEAEVLAVDDGVSVRVLRHPRGEDCGLDIVDVDPARLVVVDWLPPASAPLLPARAAERAARSLELATALVTHDFPPAVVDGAVVDGWLNLPCRACGLARHEIEKECA